MGGMLEFRTSDGSIGTTTDGASDCITIGSFRNKRWSKVLYGWPTQHRSPFDAWPRGYRLLDVRRRCGCALAIPPGACSGEAPARYRSEFDRRFTPSCQSHDVSRSDGRVSRVPGYWPARDGWRTPSYRGPGGQPPCTERL